MKPDEVGYLLSADRKLHSISIHTRVILALKLATNPGNGMKSVRPQQSPIWLDFKIETS